MGKWHLRESDLKKYPHFDPVISAEEAEALATDPRRVAQHTFYPLMLYDERWNRFAKKGDVGEPKSRLIRYAARRDAYIFSYYRHILSELYEAEVHRLGLTENVIAYRRIPEGKGGKCNIHFARDAFLKIQELGNCYVVALDISSYFESLDHDRLKALWCRLLRVEKLPPDHFRVFKAITRYSYVEKAKVYERLGHFGVKRMSKAGKPIQGYLTPFGKIPKQLCHGRQFRQKIAGHGAEPSIVQTRFKPYGIPQGAPISDLLANLYLIDFDTTVLGWVRSVGGSYLRYSDDILVMGPGGEAEGLELMQRIQSLIGSYGSHLAIKGTKSFLFTFRQDGGGQKFAQVYGSRKCNGLEYLGFRFDGRSVFLRDSTLSNLYRKVTLAAKRDAGACARRYPDKDVSGLCDRFNFEPLIKRFGKVESFGEKHQNYRTWTFWTYAKRAADVFGPLGHPIRRQLRNYRSFVRRRVEKELRLTVVRRQKPSSS